MVSFESDYIAGAHPEVLRRLTETNAEPLPGYGSDRYCESAKEKIRNATGIPDAEIAFLSGGTQANAVVISSMLADYEGVIAAKTGHISTHEAGAIEYTGHEVLELPQEEGKIAPETLEKYLSGYFADENREHMTYPGMVYLCWPTEYGTLYSRAELESISGICRRYGIPLYLDGARLAYGLMSPEADLDLPAIAELCDVFYIGGTKVGALCGEAVVFTKGNMPKHFLTSVKRRGALLAKGRLEGVQFDALFTDGLYFRIGRHAVGLAEKMKEILSAHGIPLAIHSPTNQQFPVLEDGMLERLAGKVAYSFWEKKDENHTVIRLATGWSTSEEDLRALDAALAEITGG